MNARDDRTRTVAVAGGSVALSDELLDGLLHALARLDSRGAETVREEIAALRLAGGEIRLVPSEVELAALTTAARQLAPALSDLEFLCADRVPAASERP